MTTDLTTTSQESTEKPKKKETKVSLEGCNLEEFLYEKYGIQEGLCCSIWYWHIRNFDTWMSPDVFERMLLLDDELETLAKEATDEESIGKVKKKILEIFKTKYLTLLWYKLNSIRDHITEYIIEKVKTKSWEQDKESAKKCEEEPKEIKFVKPH